MNWYIQQQKEMKLFADFIHFYFIQSSSDKCDMRSVFVWNAQWQITAYFSVNIKNENNKDIRILIFGNFRNFFFVNLSNFNFQLKLNHCVKNI